MSDSKKWKYRPNSVTIEAVQGCNRRCEFCGTMGMEKKIHFMSLKTLSHICKLIKEANLDCQIRIANHGEPTLHPNIVEFIRTIRYYLPDKSIHMFTNGTIIEKRPELVKDMFSAGLNNLLVDEYSDHLVGNFVSNNPICKRYEIVYQGAGVPLLPKTNGKRICIVPPIDSDGKKINRKLCNHCGAGMPPLNKQTHKRCSIIFRELAIRYDGNIAICCNDFRGNYPVCNIMHCKIFEEAWFHPRLESARKYIIKGDRCFFPCNICNASPIRAGLLPNWGKTTKMEEPTAKDWEIVNRKFQPLAIVEKREWEK